MVIWANGSDGLPIDSVLNDYNHTLQELHWQNAVVDTVAAWNRFWSGIHMVGPYVWRPPYYWFSDRYGPGRGSSAEEGDNETIPPLESLKKFIPADRLWPINEYWYFHAGANEGNSTLENVKRVLEKRYGPSTTCYNRFVRWRKAGVWDRLLAAVSAGFNGELVMIDSTCMRVHQHERRVLRRQ